MDMVVDQGIELRYCASTMHRFEHPRSPFRHACISIASAGLFRTLSSGTCIAARIGCIIVSSCSRVRAPRTSMSFMIDSTLMGASELMLNTFFNCRHHRKLIRR